MNFHFSNRFELFGNIYELVGCSVIDEVYYSLFKLNNEYFRKDYQELSKIIHEKGCYLDNENNKLTDYQIISTAHQDIIPFIKKDKKNNKKELLVKQNTLSLF